jgi:hypothetical protein
MCVKLLVEHCYNRSPKEKIIKMQGRILKIWKLGRSSMQRKQRRGADLPFAATTLSKAERKEFCEFLHYLKVPSGYSSNFKRLVSVKDIKMNFNLLQSHDCHVLMTALLPVALRGIKTELVRDAVTSLCLFFNVMEKKVIDEEKLLNLKRRHFETLCLP